MTKARNSFTPPIVLYLYSASGPTTVASVAVPHRLKDAVIAPEALANSYATQHPSDSSHQPLSVIKLRTAAVILPTQNQQTNFCPVPDRVITNLPTLLTSSVYEAPVQNLPEVSTDTLTSLQHPSNPP